MVASREVEIRYYGGVGRQRGRGFGALAQVLGRTAIPFLSKYIVPAAKRVGADFLEIAVPKNAGVVSGRKMSRQLQRMWEDRLWENSWVKVAGNGVRAESFQQNLHNKSVGRGETFLQTFLVGHVKQQFSVPTFCGIVRKSWKESSNCSRCPLLAWTRKLSNYRTRWKLHRVWISNRSDLKRWFETVFVGIEAQICQRSWLRYIWE